MFSDSCCFNIGEFQLARSFRSFFTSLKKRFSVKHPKFTLIRTSMNNWKNKCKTGIDNFVFKKEGRPNVLDDNLIKKVEDIAIGTRQAGGVINRRQLYV